MISDTPSSSNQEIAAASLASPVNPWLGLSAYTEKDCAMFFGRERETAELLRLIDREALTVVFGRSGLGKTSLLRAGVIPRLRETSFFPIAVRLDYSGHGLSPVQQLKALAREAAQAAALDIANEIPENPDATLWEYFHTAEFWSPRNDLLTPILLIDQFEEVFTIGRNLPSTTEFLEQLADLLENRVPQSVRERVERSGEPLEIDADIRNYKVVLSLREDFVSKLDSLRSSMPAIMRNRFALEPLSGERALSIIVRAGGNCVTENVACDIVAAVAGRNGSGGSALDFVACAEIEPAYLSVMCYELFQRMVDLGRGTITHDLVMQEHGGILEGLYERSFADLDANTRLFVEDRLLTASGFRAAVPVAEALAEGISSQDMETLVDRRLLRFEDRLGTQHIELTHDLLAGVVMKSRDLRRAKIEREEEERKRAAMRRALFMSRLRAAIAASVAFVTLAGVALWYLAYVRPTVSYYKYFTKQYGRVKPYGKLNAESVKHRAYSFKITSRGYLGEILQVDAVDSSKRLTMNNNVHTYLSFDSDDNSLKSCRWQEVYDSNGHIIYETGWDQHGRMVWGLVYAPPNSSGDLIHVRRATFVGPDNIPLPQGHSRAEIIEFEYDSNGYEKRQSFLDRKGNLAPGPDGAFGRAFEYDSEGRQTKDTSLDKLGHAMNDAAGNSSNILEYDRDGNVASVLVVDKDNRPTLWNQRGVSRIRYAYDRWGNEIRESYFGPEGWGNPVVDLQEGSYSVEYTYDEHGNLVGLRNFDAHGQPMDRQGEFAYHRIAMTYNSGNLRTTEAFFNRSGQNISGPEAWHEARLQYDQNGYQSEAAYFDNNGQPVNSSDGYHKVVSKNDALGNAVEVAYFGIDGKPTVTKEGRHIMRSSYDGRGRVTEEAYFGIDGKPCTDSSNGAHKFRRAYDRFGDPTLEEYFDTAGAPTNSKAGYQRKVSVYNSFGSITQETYFDRNSNPVLVSGGYHEVMYKYDDSGLLIEMTDYDTHEKVHANSSGIARFAYSYNEKRQLVKTEYFGVNDEPVNDGEGVHMILISYDAFGRKNNEIKKSALGYVIGESKSSATTTRQIRDSKNRVIEDGTYDQHNQLAANSEGFAMVRYEYDESGNITAFRYYDANGKLVNRRGIGAIIRKKYDSQKNVTEEAYFDANDRPVISHEYGAAKGKVKYDQAGRMIDLAAFDPQNKPMEGLGGFARKHWIFDSTGKESETDYYDRFGVLILRQTAKNDYYPSEASRVFLRNLGKSVSILVAELSGETDSTAKKVHIHVGDVLLSYDGVNYDGKSIASALEWIKGFEVGPDRMRKLEILRDGKKLVLQVPRGKLGVRLVDAKID